MNGRDSSTLHAGRAGAGWEGRFVLTGRLVLGLVVIAVGVIFLLDQLHLANARELLRWWPGLTLAYGLMLLSGFCCRRSVTAGLLVSLFSGWLLLQRFGWIDRAPWEFFWPIVLLVVGSAMVIAALRGRSAPRDLESASGTFRAFALWSGSERKVVSEDFRGGEVTAVMGGHEIDLRPAKMVGGGPAVVDVFVWWGGVEFRVPPDWKVSHEPIALLGGIDDKSHAPEGEVKGHLIIKGLIIMGGVGVKN